MEGIEKMPEDSEESFAMELHSDHHPTKPSQEEEKNVDSLRDCNSEEHKSGLTIAIKTEPKETELCLLMDESGCVDDPLQCVSVDLGGTSLVIKEETCDFNSETDEYRLDDDPLLHALQMKDNHSAPLLEGDAEAEGIDLIKMIFETDGEELKLQPTLTARPLTEDKRKRRQRTCLSRNDPADRIRHMRAAETDEQAAVRREKARLQVRSLRLSKRAMETEEQAELRRALQRDQVYRARAKRQGELKPGEQKPSVSQEQVQRLRAARKANETAEETAARLAQQREQTQKYLSKETPEAASRRIATLRLRARKMRTELLANETAEQAEQRLAQQRQQGAEARAKRMASLLADGDKDIENRRIWAQKQRERRSNETAEETAARLAHQRELARRTRAQETPEAASQRLALNRLRVQRRRAERLANETAEQAAQRLAQQRQQGAESRAKRMASWPAHDDGSGGDKQVEDRSVWAQKQREERRLRERIVKMKQRLTEQLLQAEEDEETAQQRKARLLKESRRRRQRQMDNETPEQAVKRKRRQAAQSYMSRIRLEAVETPEESAARRQKAYMYMKRRHQQILATETPEEHAARNERSRLYQRKQKERRDLVSADFDDITRKRKRKKESTSATTTVTSCVPTTMPTTMETKLVPPLLFQPTMES